jgi:hypothetical protein
MARTRSPAHAGASIITGIDTNPMTMLAKQARPYLKARLPYGFPLAAQRVAVGPVRTPFRLPLSCSAPAASQTHHGGECSESQRRGRGRGPRPAASRRTCVRSSEFDRGMLFCCCVVACARRRTRRSIRSSLAARCALNKPSARRRRRPRRRLAHICSGTRARPLRLLRCFLPRLRRDWERRVAQV